MAGVCAPKTVRSRSTLVEFPMVFMKLVRLSLRRDPRQPQYQRRGQDFLREEEQTEKVAGTSTICGQSFFIFADHFFFAIIRRIIFPVFCRQYGFLIATREAPDICPTHPFS